MFNASIQLKLATVQLNNNQLTGTIPAEVFRLPGLQTFVALSNCFHGTIPAEVCNTWALSTLVLDGLSSATSCRHTLPSGAYLLSRSVGGTLPQCLFGLANLLTLHLSGNAFTGSLPAGANPPANLSDVSLSHNQLSGTIPAAFQQRRWSNLDVSYNRLSGTLQPDFRSEESLSNESTVSLENNRLSGQIPGSLQQMQNVSLLGTNLFECNLARSNLPQHDSGRGNYQCGSTGFNIPYYLWLCLVVPIAAFVLWRWKHPLSASSHLVTLTRLVISWYDSSQRVVDGRPVLAGLMHALDTLWQTSAYCAMYVTVVLVPCYLLLSHYYGTLTHQYAWTVSAAFLSGAVPVVELPLWLLLLGVVFAAGHRALARAEYFAQPFRTVSTVGKTVLGITAEVRNRALIRTLFVLINLVVVVGVNVLYVYIAIYRSSALLVLAQVLMSFFKLLWSSVCMDAILRALVQKFAPEFLAGDASLKAYRAEFLSLQLFVSLLNSIVIPCLVVAGISPDCFYNVFQPAPVVRAHFSVVACEALISGGACLGYASTEYFTKYDAPYTYTYQCSSSLITYYAPAYVNLCIVAVFVSPLTGAVGAYLLSKTSAESAVHCAVRRIAPRIVMPLDHAQGATATIMNANQLLVTLVTYLGVLLTFGTMLPPLGVALAVTVAMVVLFTKLKIGCFLCSAEEQGQLDKFVRILEQQCEGAGSASFLLSALWMLVTQSCLFYTLFLFDTLGDAVGFQDALWVLIVVPLLPACMYLVYAACQYWQSLHHGPRSVSRDEACDGIELEVVEGVHIPSLPSDTGKETLNVLVHGTAV